MRQTVTPIGLITEPNTYGQYPPGALRQALNCVMRRPGIIEPLPRDDEWDHDVDSGVTIRKIFGGIRASNLLTATNGGVYWSALVSSTQITFSELASDPGFSTGIASAVTHRDRRFLVCSDGVLELGDSAGTLAGFAAPAKLSIQSSTSTDASVMEDQKTASYRAVIRRPEGRANAFTKHSPPTQTLRVSNNSGNTEDNQLRVRWGDELQANLAAGDVIELYRTDMVAIGTDPGNVFYLVAEYVITSSDISGGEAYVWDYTPSGAGGRELYTNPGELGPESAKYPPPACDDIAVYNGYAFYLATDLAGYVNFRIPGKWSSSLTGAADITHGIGTRTTTGDISSGTNTILNVADTSGIVEGQVLAGSGIPAGSVITNVSGTTITMDNNATATTVGLSFTTTDVIEINGTDVQIPSKRYIFDNGFISGGVDSANVRLSVPIDVGSSLAATADDADGVEVTIFAPWYYYGSPTVRATNGQNYSPALPEIDETVLTGDTDTRTNRLLVSLKDQPDSVPPGRELLVGNGTIYRVVATKDALFVFCSDGLYRITGDATNVEDLRVDNIDPKLVLAARGSVDTLQSSVFAYTNRGLVMVTTDGVREVSDGVIGDILPGQEYSDTWLIQLACDETTREVWVMDDDNTAHVIYNVHRDRFTTYDPALFHTTSGTDIQAITYFPDKRAIAVALGYSSALVNDIRYFNTTVAAHSDAAAIVDFQPLLADGDENTLKEWHDLTLNFENVGPVQSQTMEVIPRFNESNLQDSTPTDIPVYLPNNGADKESRATAAVNRNAPALASTIMPGFAIGSGVTEGWRFKGLSMRWSPGGEEETRRGADAPGGG